MKNQPFTILLHFALVIILTGAFVTHFLGIQGKITLYTDAPPADRFQKDSGPGNGELPFSIRLDKVEIDYYPATVTPMDYRSVITIDSHKLTIAMNRVGEYRGWRFYQSGISSHSSTLSVSHDPWGIGITYTGYALLGLGMLGFFFQPKTPWRSLLKKYRRALPLLLLFSTPVISKASSSESFPLPAMQRPLASNFGKVLVYWNDRICPLQTMAHDITALLYGGESYKGYTPEQILSGWLFYYDRWERDFRLNHPAPESLPAYPESKKDKRMAEQSALIKWIGTGEIFFIY
ncbi:MAG: cytochrome c biogenesis protein ResB, partial [Muribaculaceae bacterium]|nr:cytochrome c biogenesis protein ResB [Muribaculaceae bacterium]